MFAWMLILPKATIRDGTPKGPGTSHLVLYMNADLRKLAV